MNSILFRIFLFLIALLFSVEKIKGQCPNAPEVYNLNWECDVTFTYYIVSFDIFGGDSATYIVTPFDGVLDGHKFTSNPIPNGQGFMFVVDDTFHCDPVTVQENMPICECESEAGTMDLSHISSCGTEPIVALLPNNTFLDANDVLQFVLHTNPGNNLGTIISISPAPVFNFDPDSMEFETTYYISTVVGNDDGTGNVDMNDPCLSVSEGTPVFWHEVPSAYLEGDTVLCSGNETTLSVTFNGSFPISFTLVTNGQSTDFLATSSPFLIPVTTTTTFTHYNILNPTDNNGCVGITGGQTVVESYYFPPFCLIESYPVICDELGSIIVLDCFQWQYPVSFIWSNGETSPSISNLSAGLYSVTVSTVGGCTLTQDVQVWEVSPNFQCSPTISGSINCINSEVNILMNCNGGALPYNYLWFENGNIISNSSILSVSTAGTYIGSVTDGNGCEIIDTFIISSGILDCGYITGTLTSEDDGNCTLDSLELPLANWMVRATGTTGEEFFDFTDSLGQYSFQAVPDGYEVEVIPPMAFWDDCTGIVSITLEDSTDIDTVDFHQYKAIKCPLMEVDISTPLLRRCFDNNYTVSYCNYGSETAIGASIDVMFDSLITMVSASLPFTGPINGVYTFALGDVESGGCGIFYILTKVSCNAVLGQTLCAEAHVYPDSLCNPSDPNWSGAIIDITSNCTADSVIFTITNNGTNDMTDSQGFIVVEDGVMLLTNDVQLLAGASTTISFPANGSTYNLLVDQVAGIPGYSNPSLFVEGCGTNSSGSFSTGFASQFPEDDAAPFISIDCQEVVGSFDPNDKRGYPLGYSDEHIIEPGQMLDYHIRFQNTGTDTAFKVVVHDIIVDELDISTLRLGATSHPYQFEIHEDTLVFIFENILLPDSNINEPASHGFVKFSIGQRVGLPLSTVIENEAAIFFDFNDPIYTNKTTHQIGELFVVNAMPPAVLQDKINCFVYPNPMGEEAVVVVHGAERQNVVLRLYDVTGRYLRSETINGGTGKIYRKGLADGLYFFEIVIEGASIGHRKVALHSGR